MKKFALTLLAMLTLSWPAAAGSWTGCYGGAALGYASTVTDIGFDISGFTGSATGLGTDGTVASLRAGCDYQMDRVVIGAWGDYSWLQDHEQSISIAGLGSAAVGLDTMWAAGARAGVTVGKDTLIYALIGYTEAHGTGGLPNLDGLVYGGGIEVALGGGFTTSLEYRYADLDKLVLTDGGDTLTFDPGMHMVRAGLTYRFSFDGTPIPAK